MGYRGEDVSRTDGAWGRQAPWPSPPGTEPGSAGAWDDGSAGYPQDNPAADDDGFGYGPVDGYPGRDQQGYGQYGQNERGQYGPGQDAGYGQDGHGQDTHQYGQYGQDAQYGENAQYGQYGPGQDARYGEYDGYGQETDQGAAGGYGGPSGYGQHDDYGYPRGANPSSGYGQAGYGQRPAPTSGYDQPPGPAAGAAGYDQRPVPGYGPGGGGYQDLNGGYDRSGASPAQRAVSGGYPALPDGPGGYPAEDAGNDWYGGQPAAANGASFADTGTYTLNGRIIDEYGTGPRRAFVPRGDDPPYSPGIPPEDEPPYSSGGQYPPGGQPRDPVRGYPPGPAQGNGLPSAATIPAISGPQAVPHTGQQERYDEYASYPQYGRYGQDAPDGRPGRGAGDGYPGQTGRAAYDDAYDAHGARDGYAAPGSYGEPGYDAYQEPSPQGAMPGGDGRDGYNDYESADYESAGDPYQDRYGAGSRATGGAGRGANRAGAGRRATAVPFRGKRLLLAALAVIVVGIIGVAAYVFVLKPHSPAANPNSQGPLPTSGSVPSSQQACEKQLGTYCHIELRTDDPTPLTTAELFPPAFTNETDKTSYSLVSTKVDKTCSNAVIGQDLVTALASGKCTQVLRASYVSGNGKIMGTIGVINLATTNEAHYAGKVVGQNDFIAPLTAAKGVASKLGNGTGVVEAEFKGHYLILIWSEFVNGATPSTKAQDNQLEQFGNDLVAGTANITLSQRMVTGAPSTPGTPS